MFFYRIEEILFKIEKSVVTVLLAITFVAVLLQTVARYFYLPIIDTTEVSIMSLPLFAFMGLGLGVYTKQQISIEIVDMIRSKRLKFVMLLFQYISILVFAVVYFRLAQNMLSYVIKVGEATTELRIPLWIPYVTLITGLILMGFHTLGDIIRLFRGEPHTGKNLKDGLDSGEEEG